MALLVWAALGGGVSAGAASPRDSLSQHERQAILILVAGRTCADCEAAPNKRTLTWRFAGDLDTQVAYVALSYRSLDRERFAWLLGYSPYDGRWRIKARSQDGTTRFSCTPAVLVNPSWRNERQLRLIRRIARCV